jgi:hypothetical protein
MLAVIVHFNKVVLADPRNFTLEMAYPSHIIHLYMSPTSSDSWGDDILDVDVLPPGESVDITFDASVGRTCIYDILVVHDDEPNTTQRD